MNRNNMLCQNSQRKKCCTNSSLRSQCSDIQVQSKLEQRRSRKEEVFNLKNNQCQKRFKEKTTNTLKFSKIFDKEDDLEFQAQKFLKLFKRCIHKCFIKSKIGDKEDTEYKKLYIKWKDVKNKDDTISKKKTKELDEELAGKYAEGIYKHTKNGNRKYKT